MPPKARITKEMILDAGFRIVQSEGQDSLNVRRIASELHCSTQPVMYHYQTVDDLKTDIYHAADSFHTDYIMRPDANAANPMLSIGLRYIRFAYEEKHLFRFLFQSDQFRNMGFRELLAGEAAGFMLQPLMQQAGLTEDEARNVFEMLFFCAHGYASLLANNSLEYDAVHCAEVLTAAFMGSIGYSKGGNSLEGTV